jgi:diphthine synthase
LHFLGWFEALFVLAMAPFAISASVIRARIGRVPKCDSFLGELTFVGLGLGARGVSLDGAQAIASSDLAYIEEYTSPASSSLIKGLEEATGRRLTIVGREFVEDGRKLLDEASKSKVSLAVQGDPMIATTHTELRVRAIAGGIATRVVHGATIPAAAASETGLHYYKFGGTITFTRESASHHQDVYRRVHRNLLEGQHSLILLEYDVEKREGAEPPLVFERLLDAETNFKRGVLSERTFAVVLGRVGMEGQELVGGPIGELRKRRFGAPPHCVIIPGRLHFTEEEALAAILSIDRSRVVDNSLEVRRTAQVLLPRYVEKAKKALAEARGALKGRHDALLDNAEIYLEDSERFLANNEDELAMLSIGYAEGLVDALSFTGEVKLSW